MKLTTGTVKSLSLPAGKTELIVFDDDIAGFGLRLRDGGSRSLIFQYKIGTKHRRIALGSVSAVNFTETRKQAQKYYARVKLGEDPASDKAVAKIKAGETFEAAAAQYLARLRERERAPRSYVDIERHLLVYAKMLHGLQLTSISRRDVATCLAKITTDNGAVTANRTRSTVSAVFAWAIGEGMIEHNPVAGTNRNEETTRDRVLSPAELRLIWNGLSDDHHGAILKLLALTGQRRGEIADLRWSEVKETEIVLPAERTKNGRPHTVPLSGAARAIIEAQPRRVNADGKPRDLIFGLGDGGFDGWSKCRKALDARITKAAGKPPPHWTAHDLRRSFATHAAEIGIAPHIVEAVLNHISGHKAGVAGIYNKATYSAEKRAALERWADQLLAWVEGRDTNVVPLQRA
jgi:integrase